LNSIKIVGGVCVAMDGPGLYSAAVLGANANRIFITNAPVTTNGINILRLTPTNS
jgi:hypothetical protein